MHLVGEAALAALEAWQAHRGGLAPGPLPFAGGRLEQPACLMEAFAVMNAMAARLQPKAKR